VQNLAAAGDARSTVGLHTLDAETALRTSGRFQHDEQLRGCAQGVVEDSVLLEPVEVCGCKRVGGEVVDMSTGALSETTATRPSDEARRLARTST
jgi:hypothetical protein